jgi:GTPase involved in cell partitioning and DNA repair
MTLKILIFAVRNISNMALMASRRDGGDIILEAVQGSTLWIDFRYSPFQKASAANHVQGGDKTGAGALGSCRPCPVGTQVLFEDKEADTAISPRSASVYHLLHRRRNGRRVPVV